MSGAGTCTQVASHTTNAEGDITGERVCGKPAPDLVFGGDPICITCAQSLRREGNILGEPELAALATLETRPGMLHAFTDDEETVIAVDEADARAVMQEIGGPYVWTADQEITQLDDERTCTICIDGDHGEQHIKKTYGQWAIDNGRGYLCGPI